MMADRCKSCQTPLEWVVSTKGKRIPLDVDVGAKPNILIGDDGLAHVVPAGYGDRTPHWATCPDADAHRRRGA